MARQNQLLSVLATILLILVAIAVYTDKPEKDAADPDAPAQHELFAFDADGAQSLTLQSASGTLSFAKAEGVWKMTAPREIAVEERRVTEIIDRIDGLKVQDKSFDGALKDFGLDEAARVTVTIGTADGKTLTVYVGRDAPAGYRGYVAEKPEGPALLASSRVNELVARTADDFRAKEIWKVSTGTARRIRIEDAGASVVLRKDDHGWWIGDEGPRASSKAIEEWLSRASMLRADSFLDGADPASVGVATPTTTLLVEDEAGTHTITLGQGDAAGVAAQTEAGLVRLPAETAELVKVDGWLDETLVPVRRVQLETVALTLGDKSVRYARAESGWTDEKGVETPAGDALLELLTTAKADRSGEPAVLGATWGTLSLSEGAARNEILTFGQELPTGGRAAQDAAGGPPFRVPAETIAALQATLP